MYTASFAINANKAKSVRLHRNPAKIAGKLNRSVNGLVKYIVNIPGAVERDRSS